MFTNAKNPRWADREHTKIILYVRFIGEEEYVQFVAAQDDCTTHGPMLYNFAVNGIFGEIALSDIERIIAGELPVPEGYVQEDGGLRPMTREERIIAGLDEMPPGYKVAGGEIIPMTQVERIIAGLEELPFAHKLADGKLVLMTLLEQLDAGQITQADYEQTLVAENESELQRRLADLQTPEALAQAELDEEYAAERKVKLAALLAVKTQPGWPVTVEWPE